MKREINTKEPRGLKLIGVVIVLLVITVIAAVSWFLYSHTVDLLIDNLRQRLLSIATTQAVNIDWRDIDPLQVEGDWKKPEWRKVVRQMKQAKDNNPNIVFMYIFRKKKTDPTQMEFVADAESINPYANVDADPANDVDANGDGQFEPDGADKLQWPGQDYPTPPEEAFQAYNGPLTNRDLYEDAYGKVLTGYAQIKDGSGRTIAILGTDIKADDFLVVTRQTLYPFLMFIAFLMFSIITLSTILISLWNKRVEIFAELDRQKDELISIVSHQLATPVTSVKWYLEMLLDGDSGELNEEQKKQLMTMQGVTEDLVDLVGMILDVSRIQLGRMKVDRSPVDLGTFFTEVLAVIEPKATVKKQQFIKSLPGSLPTASLDKRLMRMTLENLLSNAVKYTPEGGKVELTVTVNDHTLRYSVKDTGCGIPKEDQEKIFGKLFRATNVRNTEGNGLGLFAAKGAAEAQGGRVWFESESGKGTTFTVEVPITSSVAA